MKFLLMLSTMDILNREPILFNNKIFDKKFSNLIDLLTSKINTPIIITNSLEKYEEKKLNQIIFLNLMKENKDDFVLHDIFINFLINKNSIIKKVIYLNTKLVIYSIFLEVDQVYKNDFYLLSKDAPKISGIAFINYNTNQYLKTQTESIGNISVQGNVSRLNTQEAKAEMQTSLNEAYFN